MVRLLTGVGRTQPAFDEFAQGGFVTADDFDSGGADSLFRRRAAWWEHFDGLLDDDHLLAGRCIANLLRRGGLREQDTAGCQHKAGSDYEGACGSHGDCLEGELLFSGFYYPPIWRLILTLSYLQVD
jgi:hypothetical protein